MSEYTFEPFQKVLVRHNDASIWKPDFFWRRNWFTPEKIDTVAGLGYEQCIPYEGNEHLCDTSGSLEPKYQPKEGDLVAVSKSGQHWIPGIFVREADGMFTVHLQTNDSTCVMANFCEPLRKHFNIPEE